ncbi:MAG: hypothetical protein SWH61_06060 [Thermodesulfobacteriota bacterium]|nr:hypothetical protein [Thermodesulfobacteriota bacterium]
MGMRRGSILFAGLLSLVLIVPAFGAIVEHYQYIREESGEQVPVKWLLEKEDGYKLNYQAADVKTVTETDCDLATLRWFCENPPEGTDIRAERYNNTIRLTGMLEGKPLNRVVSIDDAPWFQATTLSLRSFVLSGKTEMPFWILRPHSLKPYKLIAKKETVEYRDVLGQSVEAQKVRISAGGVLAALWSCEYWFKKDDGMLIQCETPKGPPGSPEVVIRLTAIVR